MNNILHTKWGNAKIDNGYYRITSWKGGNNGKLLHRLIWEDFYNTEVPKGYVIHHRNFNKLDNCILNLQLMRESEHNSLHNTGKNHWNYGNTTSDETRKKISDALICRTFSEETKQKMRKPKSEEVKRKMSIVRNSSGYLNVYKIKTKSVKQGFTWRYSYSEGGKQKSIESVDIDKLKAKVKAKGLLWEELVSNV